MDIAVVIPVLNGEAHIGETLDSVLAQTLQPQEIIVVDDGSTDRTREVVGGYKKITLLKNPDTGPSAARNHGLHHTKAEAVAFLDHDDLWHPDHLRQLADLLQEYPASPVASAHRVTFTSAEMPNYSVSSDEAAVELYDPWTDFPRNSIQEPVCHLMRRAAVNEVGGWSPAFDGCADYHLLIKLALIGPFARTENTSAAYRTRANSYLRRVLVERGHEHYALRVAACKDAIDRRRDRGLRVDEYVERWEAMNALADLVRARAQDDASSFRQAVRRFDSIVARLSSDVVQRIRSQFHWFITPHLRASRNVDFTDEALGWLRQWPADADRAREVLPWWGLCQLHPAALIRRNAFQPSVWPYIFRHVIRQVRAKMAPQ